jgi:hypothetical protein
MNHNDLSVGVAAFFCETKPTSHLSSQKREHFQKILLYFCFEFLCAHKEVEVGDVEARAGGGIDRRRIQFLCELCARLSPELGKSFA